MVLHKQEKKFNKQFSLLIFVIKINTMMFRRPWDHKNRSKEVSLFQKLFCTLLYNYVAGKTNNCPDYRGVLILEALKKKVPLCSMLHLGVFAKSHIAMLSKCLHVCDLLSLVVSCREQ